MAKRNREAAIIPAREPERTVIAAKVAAIAATVFPPTAKAKI